MTAFSGCSGSANIKGTPTLEEKICPVCGEIIEMFSPDAKVQCVCGFIAYNENKKCAEWCRYARECLGEKLYDRIINGKQDKNKCESEEI